jgi:hypothetical protein
MMADSCFLREQPDRQNLRELSAAYAHHAGLPASLALDSWPDVIDALLGLGTEVPESVPVIIDEFPNLVAQTPASRAGAAGGGDRRIHVHCT